MPSGRPRLPQDAVPSGLQQGGGEGLPGECKSLDFFDFYDEMLSHEMEMLLQLLFYEVFGVFSGLNWIVVILSFFFFSPDDV